MVVFEQSGGIRKKWLYSGKNGSIRAKVVVFGQNWLYSEKWLYSGKSGCIGKGCCIRAKMMYSCDSCCIQAKGVHLAEVIVIL